MIEQGSNDWHLWRSQGIGSSDIGSIMGLNKYKSLRRLWLEKTGIEKSDFETNEYVEYGKHKEKYALIEYEWQTGASGFEPRLFIHPKYSFIRASFDAFNNELGYGLEIKSPYFPKNLEQARRGKVDRKYYAQLQWLMLASQTNIIKYIVYDGSMKIWVKDVFADPGYQRRMLRYARWFWGLVEKRIDPKKRVPRMIEIDDVNVE